MSGPTNRRFVRAAWTLLAFQFVAALGALALAIWASSKVQNLIDQRDQLQARVTQLESRFAPVEPVAEVPPAADNLTSPIETPIATPAAPEPAAKAPPAPPRTPPVRNGGSGVTIHTPRLPPVIVETPLPPSEPPDTYVPPRQPPVRYPPRRPPEIYVPPREPPQVYVPPRRPPVRYPPPRDPPRQPPVTYVPPRQPPSIVRPNVSPRPTPQRPVPGVVLRPTRPVITRPAPNVQGIDPRRIRRPRPADTEPQPDPPK